MNDSSHQSITYDNNNLKNRHISELIIPGVLLYLAPPLEFWHLKEARKPISL